jgi:glycosyltransferase involved in cell wall biosynthesis
LNGPSRDRSGDESPRVLLVGTVASTIEAFLIPFAVDFDRWGWRVEAAASGVTGGRVDGPPVARVHDVAFSRRPAAVVRHLRAFLRIRRVLRRGHFDLVHLHTSIASALTRMAVLTLRPSRRPAVVYVAHGLHFYDGAPFSAKAFEVVERALAHVTDVIFTINAEDEASAERLLACDVEALPGVGVDLEHYRADSVAPAEVADFTRRHEIEPGTFVILMVASLDPRKQHHRLLAAMAGWDRRAMALLAGAGPQREVIERQVGKLGLADSVTFLGQIDDLRVAYRVTDCLVLPSAMEGLPRSILEAMAMGTPVVGSDIRGTRDLLEGGVGLLVDTSDPVAFRAALEGLADDPTRRDEFAAAALERVAAYSEDRVLSRHAEVIERFDPRR